MSTANTAGSSAQLATLRQQARAKWNSLAPRERLYVGVAGLLVGFYIVFAIFVAPAWHTMKTAPAAIDKLDLELQQMQRLAAEAKGLRSAPPVSTQQAQAALKAATDRLGDVARYTLIGDRATVTFTNATAEALAGWMAEVRTVARGRIAEAQLTRGPTNLYGGSVVVALGGSS